MATLAETLGFTKETLSQIFTQGFDLIDAGDLDGAEHIFQGLTALDPHDANAHAALGSVQHEKGNHDAAIESYQRSLAIDTYAPLARVNLGELRCARGEKEGLDDLRVAAAIPSAVQPRARALLKRFAAV